jgi:hypothetical protein
MILGLLIESPLNNRMTIERLSNDDELVKSQEAPVIVIPVKTGIQENQALMDSRFRGSDGLGEFLREHQ